MYYPKRILGKKVFNYILRSSSVCYQAIETVTVSSTKIRRGSSNFSEKAVAQTTGKVKYPILFCAKVLDLESLFA